MNYRPLRIARLIQETLGFLVESELEFGNAIPTITDVEVDKKLNVAKVKVSVWPLDESEAALALLEKSRSRLQRLLWKELNVKPMPQIRFEYDPGIERAAVVEKILHGDNNRTVET